MNFTEWFNIQNKCHKSLYGHDIPNHDKDIMGEAWEASKLEVLKIIDNADTEFINDYQAYFVEKLWIESEIEKL